MSLGPGPRQRVDTETSTLQETPYLTLLVLLPSLQVSGPGLDGRRQEDSPRKSKREGLPPGQEVVGVGGLGVGVGRK